MYPLSCPILIKLCLDRFFEKYSNKRFYKKTVQWEPSCSMRTDGRKDRHDEANSCFSQFFEHV